MTHDPLLIYSVLQGLLHKGEVVRVDLQVSRAVRRQGILVSIQPSLIKDQHNVDHGGYLISYEYDFGVDDSGFFHRDELENHSHLKQTETGWLLTINHIRS